MLAPDQPHLSDLVIIAAQRQHACRWSIKVMKEKRRNSSKLIFLKKPNNHIYSLKSSKTCTIFLIKVEQEMLSHLICMNHFLPAFLLFSSLPSSLSSSTCFSKYTTTLSSSTCFPIYTISSLVYSRIMNPLSRFMRPLGLLLTYQHYCVLF